MLQRAEMLGFSASEVRIHQSAETKYTARSKSSNTPATLAVPRDG